MLFTPALTNKLLACCSNTMLSALTLQDGNRYLSAVETEIKGVLPKGLPFVYVQVEDRVAIANDTLRPEAIALAVFGGIAGVAALLIAGQVVSRRIRLRAADLDIIRALGASPSMTFCDDLIGTLGAVAVGSVLAGLVALGLSPLAPLGPVRPFLRVEVHADWAVIGLGVAGLLLSLGAIAALASWRALPGRARVRGQRTSSSRVTTAAARAGLPPPAITGVRFALEPGVGRSAVPVRSAILGAILAVTVVVATVTFGSSLNTLVSHPALYGWNWTYDMDGGGGLGDVPGQAAAKLLNADPLVESWSGVSYSTLQLDGINVPVMGATPRAPVAPPLLSGHGLEARDQVVLGAGTLHELHKRVGDTVEERTHNGAPVRLTIVGTATLPPIGVTGSSHLEMGSGAILAYQLIPPAARNLFEVTPGPNAILVRTRGGASEAALRSLQAIGRKLDIAINGGSVLPVQRPAQIINYGSLGTTPVFLGAALAAGAVERARHHASHIGPAQTARSGDPQDARFHRTSVGDRRVRAGGRRRRHRMRRRDPGWDRVGPRAVGPVRRRDQCRPLPHRPGRDHRGDRDLGHRAGRPGCHHSRPRRSEDGHLAAPPRRVAGRPSWPSVGEPLDQHLTETAHRVRRAGGHVEHEVLHARRPELLDPRHELVGRPHVGARRFLTRDLAQEVLRRRRLLLALREDQRAQAADRHLRWVPPDRRAVPPQDPDLVGDGGGVAGDVAQVGVARHQAERPLLPAAADEDRRTARLHGGGTLRASWIR